MLRFSVPKVGKLWIHFNHVYIYHVLTKCYKPANKNMAMSVADSWLQQYMQEIQDRRLTLPRLLHNRMFRLQTLEAQVIAPFQRETLHFVVLLKLWKCWFIELLNIARLQLEWTTERFLHPWNEKTNEPYKALIHHNSDNLKMKLLLWDPMLNVVASW